MGSSLGTLLATVALVIDVKDRTGSGPWVGALMFVEFLPAVAVGLFFGPFLLSAVLVFRIPGEKLQGIVAASRGHLHDLADGFARVVSTRPLLTVLVVWTIALGGFAASNTAQVFLAKDAFSAGDFGYGLGFGCIGLGLAIGSFGAGTWVERRSVGSVYALSILVAATGLAAAGAMPNIWLALPCFVLSGIGNGAAVVCNSLLVQRGATDDIRGRVFTVIMSVNYAMYGVGVLAA